MTGAKHVVVVGGGITGLSAAYELTRDPGVDVTVLEPGDWGGKIRSGEIGGHRIDLGADAFLVRVPEAVELCNELGLGSELVAPATGQAYIWTRGALRPIPEATVLGVPTDLDALAASGVVSDEAVARAARDLTAPADAPEGDESVGALVRRRVGDEVLERLVAPLVGGINAGDADHLSLQAVTPQLAAARDAAPSLIDALRAQRGAASTDAPVFLAPRGGMSELVHRLHEAVSSRAELRTETATSVEPVDGGWRVVTSRPLRADGVVVATPAPVAAALLPGAGALGALDHASVVMTAIAVPRDVLECDLDGSGFLVPALEGTLMTACSWFSRKWPHVASDPNVVVLRVSAGRAGDDRAIETADEDLLAVLTRELSMTMGLRGPIAGATIARYPRSFPQYAPGHLDRVAAFESTLPPGLVVTGAWARGVGIPACIRQGRAAARHLLMQNS